MSLMLTPFSPDDLASQFEPRILTRGRTLVLLGTVDVALQDDAFTATVEHLGQSHSLRLAAKVTGGRTLLRGTCTCATPACAHMAAAGLAALDRFPSLRAPSRPAARPDSSPTAPKSAPPGTLPEPGGASNCNSASSPSPASRPSRSQPSSSANAAAPVPQPPPSSSSPSPAATTPPASSPACSAAATSPSPRSPPTRSPLCSTCCAASAMPASKAPTGR